MVHIQAKTGYSKGSDTYVSGRPDYPAEVDRWLTEALGLEGGVTVLDLGAGTGKFTKRLVDTGATAIAVEPVAAMRAKLEALEVTALEGSAESLPVGDASVYVVICAQAFHWFASDATLAEIHRVLKPNGRLGLIWNVWDESVRWVEELTDIMTPYEGGTPRHGSGEWRKVFPNDGFGALGEVQFGHAHTGQPEHVIVDRIMSVSFIAALPESKRNTVSAKVRAVIEAAPELAGKDVVSFPYRTIAYCCEKI